jgi:hypothetical protein
VSGKKIHFYRWSFSCRASSLTRMSRLRAKLEKSAVSGALGAPYGEIARATIGANLALSFVLRQNNLQRF